MRIIKMISVLVCLCAVICCITTNGFAEYENCYRFEYGSDKEVYVEINEALSYEQHKAIADSIAGIVPAGNIGGDSIMLNPQCAAGNHALTYTTSYEITHYAYSTSPRCLKKEYLVATCTRYGCLYEQRTLISSTRTSACHG